MATKPTKASAPVVPPTRKERAQVEVTTAPMQPPSMVTGFFKVDDGDMAEGVFVSVGFQPRYVRVLSNGLAAEFVEGMADSAIQAQPRGFNYTGDAVAGESLFFIAQA